LSSIGANLGEGIETRLGDESSVRQNIKVLCIILGDVLAFGISGLAHSALLRGAIFFSYAVHTTAAHGYWQGTPTEGEGPVQLTSTLKLLVS
jgi:hypothetical protein